MNCTQYNITMAQITELFKSYQENDQAGDATWILTSAFIIFTMQSGFGLLEAGSVSAKNECNIMIKNAIDVIFGGLGYWLCGFSFSFGKKKGMSNGFTGYGNFFAMGNEHELGELHAKYLFQLSFATTATTIVSGAMAERTNLKAYMFFSLINFISYVFPAHWVWADEGFFKTMGVVDVAGCGPVHVVGGMSAVVASVILKPRSGMFKPSSETRRMASPTNVVLGTFMLWWGWLGFNCGSTFGVSGGKWKLASKAAVTTVNASVGGGIWSILYCYLITKQFDKKLDIGVFTGCILGGLVSITAVCALCRPWEALLIGFIGGAIVSFGISLVKYMKIDDPVFCIPVHFFCGVWGMVCVGLVGEMDTLEGISAYPGILKGGPFMFIVKQIIAALTIAAWAGVTTALELILADLIFGLRLSAEAERIGADSYEHGIPSALEGPKHERSPIRSRGCQFCDNGNAEDVFNSPCRDPCRKLKSRTDFYNSNHSQSKDWESGNESMKNHSIFNEGNQNSGFLGRICSCLHEHRQKSAFKEFQCELRMSHNNNCHTNLHGCHDRKQTQIDNPINRRKEDRMKSFDEIKLEENSTSDDLKNVSSYLNGSFYPSSNSLSSFSTMPSSSFSLSRQLNRKVYKQRKYSLDSYDTKMYVT